MALDELELELRRLPGVRSVGFSTGDDFLMVQVHVSDETSTTPTTAFETARIARRHSILPVSVEIVRWKSSEASAPHVPAPQVTTAAHAEQGGSIHAPVDEHITIDLDAEVRNEILEAEGDEPTVVWDSTEPDEDADEVLLSELDDFDDDITNLPDLSDRADDAPPRISPITSVINSISEPTRRITNDSADAYAFEENGFGDHHLETVEEDDEADEDFEAREADLEPGAVHSTYEVHEIADDSSATGSVDLTINPAVDERVRLLAVLPFPESDEIEVHLTAGGRRSVGRAPASHGLSGAAAATLDALRGFIPEHTYAVSFAHRLPEASDQFLVVAGINEPDATLAPAQRFGVAASNSPSEAAARATLHALNRTLGIAKSRINA